MKYKRKSPLCALCAAVLTLALAACGSTDNAKLPGKSADADDTATLLDGETEGVYERDGLRLLIPAEYDELVIVDTDPPGALFSVSEKASIEAAEAQGEGAEGAGWLFDIASADADELHEMLCYDMSGVEAFARDADGQYYLYCHPTDVRIVRENYNDPNSMEQWEVLNEWASTMPDTFISDNPGLVPEKHGNTELDMYLARIAYRGDVSYTLSTAAYGVVDGQGVDASPYLERLMNGVTFELADDSETPDGEYVVLGFPDDDTRFDFFLSEGAENIIRMVWSGGTEELYKAVFADGTSKASDIVSEWYDYASDAALDGSGFTGEEFVGEWQDSFSQRAMMSVKETDEQGVYDILIHWGGSYNSAVQWRMKAVAGAQDEILSYENGQKVEVTFPDDGGPEQETVIWDDGTGYFLFDDDGSLKWYDEQEEAAEECRFVKD